MDEFNQDRGFFLEKKNKLIVFSLLVFFVVLVYVIKLFSMQVIHGESFRDRAERISQRTKRIVAQRGEIYDRNATVPMVLNIDSFAGTLHSRVLQVFYTNRSKIKCPLRDYR